MSDPHSSGGAPVYVQDGARSPTHAERARTLLASTDTGALSTLAGDPAGYPFGSVVTYGLDGDGAPLMSMSTMAEHTANLDADARCSLLVSAAAGGAERLAVGRVTLLGRTTRVAEADQDAATEVYMAAHPDAFWARFPDFAIHRLDVERVRFVRGFGEMSWVTGTDFAQASADPVAPAGAGIVEHMNADHAESLREMVTAFLGIDGAVASATMLSCDRYGFEVRCEVDPGGAAYGRIAFDTTLTEPGQAREAMVRLVKAARGA